MKTHYAFWTKMLALLTLLVLARLVTHAHGAGSAPGRPMHRAGAAPPLPGGESSMR